MACGCAANRIVCSLQLMVPTGSSCASINTASMPHSSWTQEQLRHLCPCCWGELISYSEAAAVSSGTSVAYGQPVRFRKCDDVDG